MQLTLRDVLSPGQHGLPPQVTAVPTIVCQDGTVHSGDQAFTWLNARKQQTIQNYEFGTSTWFTDVGFNEPMSTSQFTFIGQADEATTPTVADNRDPTQVADPRLEALIEARSNEIPGNPTCLNPIG